MKWMSKTFSYQYVERLDKCIEEFLNSPLMANAVNVEKKFSTAYAGDVYGVYYTMNITALVWEADCKEEDPS
jgi:hypothetical protein